MGCNNGRADHDSFKNKNILTLLFQLEREHFRKTSHLNLFPEEVIEFERKKLIYRPNSINCTIQFLLNGLDTIDQVVKAHTKTISHDTEQLVFIQKRISSLILLG